MRVVKGKSVHQMDATAVTAWCATYHETVVDLGTGDGRFVCHLATRHPISGIIGVDLCEANLRIVSRVAPGNTLFVVTDALTLPDELGRVASRVTINFPWGSLLRGFLDGDPGLLAGLVALGDGGIPVDVTLNASAVAESGWTLEAGGQRVARVLSGAGIEVRATSVLGPAELCRWPTTWAKRIAFGRDPRAMRIEATAR